MLSGRKDEAIRQWEQILAMNPNAELKDAVTQNLERARAQ
jgi:hypothetical protein